MADTYTKIKIIEFPGMIARIHIPDISDEEQSKRMAAIHDAAAKLLRNNRK